MNEARQVREGADHAAAETLRLAELQAERIRKRAVSEAGAAAYAVSKSAEAEARNVREAANSEAEHIRKDAEKSASVTATAKQSTLGAAPAAPTPQPILTLGGSSGASSAIGGAVACGGDAKAPAPLFGGGDAASGAGGSGSASASTGASPFTSLLQPVSTAPDASKAPANPPGLFAFGAGSAPPAAAPSLMMGGFGAGAATGLGGGGFSLGSPPAETPGRKPFRRAKRSTTGAK